MTSFRATSVEYFSSPFEDLPSVLVSKVLSFLTFTEKLCAVEVFPAWESHLNTTESWPELVYVDNRTTRIKDRQEVCQCLRKYGRFIKRIRLNFHYHVRTSGTALMKKIATHCSQLQFIQLIETDIDADHSFKNILDSCEMLTGISLVRPWVDSTCQRNAVALVMSTQHSAKLQELVAVPETTNPEYDFGKALQPSNLTGLQTLKVKRSFLSKDALLQLAGQKLHHLSIFQDEELPLNEPLMYNEETWNQVLTLQSKFCFHAALRGIIMLRSFLPAKAPLRALILADLQASLTKGVLDTISAYYRSTLESFVCTKSNTYETVDVEDRRLPFALLQLAYNCSKLKTLVYGYNFLSVFVLLIAKRRRFICLDFPVDSITYHRDGDIPPLREHEELTWLKECGSTRERLEETVSLLQGCEWRLSTEGRDIKIQHYFKYF